MFRPDTTAEIQRVYDQKIRELSEEERFLRGLSLTHFCRLLCLAGIHDQYPALAPDEVKRVFFERLYGSVFSEEEREKIRAFLSVPR